MQVGCPGRPAVPAVYKPVKIIRDEHVSGATNKGRLDFRRCVVPPVGILINGGHVPLQCPDPDIGGNPREEIGAIPVRTEGRLAPPWIVGPLGHRGSVMSRGRALGPPVRVL